MKELMRTGEIAARLGVSLPTVRRLLRAYDVPVFVLQQAWRVRKEDAERFIEAVLSNAPKPLG